MLGLTGGIGSGKSTVAKLLAERGAKIIDADLLARDAVAPGSLGLTRIAAAFGRGVLTESGELDRAAMGALVFNNDDARQALNAIVHPEVARLAMERMQALIAEGTPVIVYDVPLLYENGLDAQLPEVIVVSVPPEVQRARVAARDGLDDAAIDARIAAQMPLAEKARRADHLIDNGGDLTDTRAQVDRLWSTLEAR